MEPVSHENKTFDKIVFSEKELKNRSFEDCNFSNCDFSNSHLNTNLFINCKFTSCNMGMAKLNNASLRDVFFKDSKLIGISFHECKDFLFQVSFENCVLDYTSFMGKKMAKTKFIDCSIKNANFSNTDLSDAIFQNCNLSGTIFEKTQLKNCDFRTAYNYALDPELNFIKKAKFSRNGLEGLLGKYGIRIDQ